MRVGSLFLVGSWAIQRRNTRDRNTNQNLLSFDNIFIHHFVESILKLLPIFRMDEPQPYGTSYIPYFLIGTRMTMLQLHFIFHHSMPLLPTLLRIHWHFIPNLFITSQFHYQNIVPENVSAA